MARLGRYQLDLLPPLSRPQTGPEGIRLGIVHLGVGAFHRAHQAVFTQRAMDAGDEPRWGICGASQRSATAARILAAQDCLYSVTEREGTSSRTAVLASVRETLFAPGQWGTLCARMASQAVSIISLTVSEKGYRMDPATRRLRTDDPDVVADAGDRKPVTVLGQLARGLQARARAGGPPVTVLCCDNMPANGATLAQLFSDFCGLLPAPQGLHLAAWAEGNVSFPSSVVDRIVPAPTPEDRERAARALGVEDEAAVVTEPFLQWVIEDCFASSRPRWEAAGASLAADVAPYEQMKLRLLNGSHSALAYLGGLAGHQLVSDVVASAPFHRYTRLLMDVDMSPTLVVPAGYDLDAYKTSLQERFANPALRHRTEQIAMDGTQKLPYRLLSTIVARLAAGHEARYATLAVAGWVRYVTAGHDDRGHPLVVDDPLSERLKAAVSRGQSISRVVGALLRMSDVFPPALADHDGFRRLLVSDVQDLARHGATAVVMAHSS